jgi:DNA-binding transcriptional MerR regulator
MLLRRPVLDRIVAGEVDLAFRRWVRPTVKTGGTLRTAAGMLQIERVMAVSMDDLTDDDARRAGIGLEELRTFLEAKEEGQVYRVELGGFIPDPRVALRENDQLSAEDIEELQGRLERLDRRSEAGPWTHRCLNLIAESPHVRAQDLADGLGVERDIFKDDVRKLKELGLTISHSPGYELSPRGRALLEMLDSLGPGL